LTQYDTVRAELEAKPRRWLITGVAGFIGSNLLQHLLELRQNVVGLDNFATGSRSNLDEVLECVGPSARGFRFLEGDIRDLETCKAACEGVDYVLHHAALGSVPRSLVDPVATNQANVDGTLNILVAARDAGVRRVVYAASSSTYGDHPGLPKVEDLIGRPLSPYAVSKYVGELYAGVFQRNYGLETIGLRYFNVFGPRQDPHGAYAAVVPRWIGNLLVGVPCQIHGDGKTSRDFSYVANVLQANLLAATTQDPKATDQVYNVAYGARTTLNELFHLMRDTLAAVRPEFKDVEPVYVDFRPGDVRHSQADIQKIATRLGYRATHSVDRGMEETLTWYLRTLNRGSDSAAVVLGSQ
jgi:UDP-N-acetylglucosamine/UDP-N-acetylgalactosamine 4-epimerase